MASAILSALAVGLILIGTFATSQATTWRLARPALAGQLVGVALLLLVERGVAAAVVALLVAAGLFGVLLDARDDEPLSPSLPPGREGATPASQLRPLDAGVLPAGSDDAGRPVRLRARRPRRTRRPVRLFDLSIIGLAEIGALSLAATRPLLGSLAADAAVDVLLLTGLAATLLGGRLPLAGGLVSIVTAAGLLLQLADPAQPPGELVLWAASVLALAIAIVALPRTDGAVAQEPHVAPPPARPRRPANRRATLRGEPVGLASEPWAGDAPAERPAASWTEERQP